jgi:hypothetical protein
MKIPQIRSLMNLNHGRFRVFLDLYGYGFHPVGASSVEQEMLLLMVANSQKRNTPLWTVE